jgi:hypothetical protein
MPNLATILIGLVVLGVFVIAAYYTYKSLKGGNCCGCEGCSKTSEENGCKDCKK